VKNFRKTHEEKRAKGKRDEGKKITPGRDKQTYSYYGVAVPRVHDISAKGTFAKNGRQKASRGW